MTDRLVELLLAACDECGGLKAHALFAELRAIAQGKAFGAAEICAHAVLPDNHRLRAAIEAVCGEVSARKLGKALARWEGIQLASLRVDCIGNDACGIVWMVSTTKPIHAKTRATNDVTIA